MNIVEYLNKTSSLPSEADFGPVHRGLRGQPVQGAVNDATGHGVEGYAAKLLKIKNKKEADEKPNELATRIAPSAGEWTRAANMAFSPLMYGAGLGLAGGLGGAAIGALANGTAGSIAGAMLGGVPGILGGAMYGGYKGGREGTKRLQETEILRELNSRIPEDQKNETNPNYTRLRELAGLHGDDFISQLPISDDEQAALKQTAKNYALGNLGASLLGVGTFGGAGTILGGAGLSAATNSRVKNKQLDINKRVADRFFS